VFDYKSKINELERSPTSERKGGLIPKSTNVIFYPIIFLTYICGRWEIMGVTVYWFA